MLTDSPKISTPKKVHYSKSPMNCRLKKSKRRDCTPDSPEMKSHTDFKPNRLRQMIEREATPKNKFLSLIEESLNEVSDNYYNFLGSQITPESLFSTVFAEKTEKSLKKISVKNLMEEILKKNLKEVKIIDLGGQGCCFERNSMLIYQP